MHHLDPTDEIGAYGPGWEYYLDMLVAARDDLPHTEFRRLLPGDEALLRSAGYPDRPGVT